MFSRLMFHVDLPTDTHTQVTSELSTNHCYPFHS